MNIKQFFKKYITYILVLSLFITLEFFVFLSVKYIYNSDVQTELETRVNTFNVEMGISINNLSKVARVIFDASIDTEKMESIMLEASHTQDAKKLATLRTELYNTFLPSYEYMKNYDVRQLHFHLPNSVSFLRFHKPSKFGDSLVGIRPSLEFVNKEKVFISCFEEGRIFNGFRNVYPIFKDKEFVGTVEVSYSFSALKNNLLAVGKGSLLFMIDSQVVKEKVFKDEKRNYAKSSFKGFNYDKDTLVDNMQIPLKELYVINRAILKEATPKLKQSGIFSLYYENSELYKNKKVLVTFIPIYNIAKKSVAYVISYKYVKIKNILWYKSKMIFLVLTFISFLISSVFYILVNYEKKKFSNIKAIATHDKLTSLYNRHGLDEVLAKEIENSIYFNKSICVIFFDIDHFKLVNDTYGHAKGDYVLEELSKLVSSKLRVSDVFARWGGEEFIIFLKTSTLENAVKVAGKLRLTIEQHDFEGIKITSSFGVAELQEYEDKEALLHRVDTLLYEAKESGRNRVVS